MSAQDTFMLPASAPLWCFAKQQAHHDALIDYAAKSGLAIEMPASKDWAEINERGLRVVNLCGPGMEGASLNREADHEALLPKLEATIEEARSRGVGQVIVFSGNRAGTSDADATDAMARGLRALLPSAERAGVVLTLEVLCKYDHPDYQADNTAFAAGVVERVDSPHVRLLYDIYHMHRMEEEVGRVVLDRLDMIAHLHIAGSPKRDLPGADQAIDYEPLVKSVLDAGYSGQWGFEFMPVGGDPVRELDEARRRFDAWLTPTRATAAE